MNADGSGQRNLTRSPANEPVCLGSRTVEAGRVVMPGRVHRLIAVGIVACPRRRGRQGCACTGRRRGVERASPRRACVARDASRGEECDRLRLRRGQGVRGHGGYPPSEGRSALSHRERDEDVYRDDRAPAHAGGDASARQHAGRARAGVVPRGGEITIRHLLGHRSGLANITDYPEWLNEAERSPSTSPINSLRFAASKPLVFEPGSQERYSNTNYIALGLVIEKVTGRSYAEELEQRILDPLGLSADGAADDAPPAGSRRRRLQPEPSLGGGRDRLERARPLPLLLRPPLRANAVRRLPRDDEGHAKTDGVFGTGLGIFSTDLACGRSWGHLGYIVDYQTLVTASEEGDRVAVVSLRGPGYIPWVGRALLCAEPPLAAGSAPAKSRIAFTAAPAPVPPALRRERRRERAAVADAHRVDLRSRLVARRAEDRLREPARRQRRGLRRERRRERAAEADAQPGARLRSRLVARRAEDRLRPRPRARGAHA